MNAQDISVGMKVRFHPLIGGRHDGGLYTVRAVGELVPGVDVAWLDGKAGCLDLRALSRPRPGADNYGLAEGG